MLWLKHFDLCSRFGFMLKALLHVLFSFNYLNIECVLSPSFSFLMSLINFQTYLIFQKRLSLKSYANLPKPSFTSPNCNVLTLG
jgi:hypothetical protein